MREAELVVLDWIQGHMRCGVLDVLMPFVSRLSDHGEIWILAAAVLLLSRRWRNQGKTLACGLVLDLAACNLILKPLIGRGRPFFLRPELALLIHPPGDASFPSGHTAVSFAAVFALKASGSRLWIPACVLAAVIAFSRLYLYVHWPTDILGGILLGACVGWAAGRICRNKESP